MMYRRWSGDIVTVDLQRAVVAGRCSGSWVSAMREGLAGAFQGMGSREVKCELASCRIQSHSGGCALAALSSPQPAQAMVGQLLTTLLLPRRVVAESTFIAST